MDNEILSKLKLSVDVDTDRGTLTWKTRNPQTFETRKGKTKEAAANAFNKQFAGKPAFNSKTQHGYLNGSFLKKRFYAHQVVWFFHHEVWPTHGIDHINGDSTDNRIENLRDVPQRINTCNRVKQSNNTSGITGVYRNSRDSVWGAVIWKNGKRIHLGVFKDFDEAVIARKKAQKEDDDFTDRHGCEANPLLRLGP